MNAKIKRLFGALLFLGFLAVYIIFVIALAYGLLPGTSEVTQLLFMAVAGTIWVLPGALIIKRFSK